MILFYFVSRFPSEFHRLLENASLTCEMFTQQHSLLASGSRHGLSVSDVRIRVTRSGKHLGLLSWDQWEYTWVTQKAGKAARCLGLGLDSVSLWLFHPKGGLQGTQPALWSLL